MAEICKNIQPISLDEFFKRVGKKVYQLKNYYSLYIMPNGELIDCGYPQALGHNPFCENFYNNLEKLSDKNFKSNLHGLNVPFEEVDYYLMDYFKLLDIMYVNPDLYTKVEKVLLSSEDRICQDLGFVKVAINSKLKTYEVIPPNPIFNKVVTAAQKDIISKLSNFFFIDLDVKLKQEQLENIKLATAVQTALNRLNNKV